MNFTQNLTKYYIILHRLYDQSVCGCVRVCEKVGLSMRARRSRERFFASTHAQNVRTFMHAHHRDIGRLFSSHYVCSILERYNIIIIYSIGSRRGHGPTRFCLSLRSQVVDGRHNVIIIIYIMTLYTRIYYAWLIVRHPRRDILIRCTIEPLAETSDT